MKNQTISALCITALFTAAIAFGGSKTFSIGSDLTVGTHKLKAGNYEVELKKDQAIITNDAGKSFSLPVTIQNAEKKFANTVAVSPDSSKLTEIDLEGTTTRLILGQ